MTIVEPLLIGLAKRLVVCSSPSIRNLMLAQSAFIISSTVLNVIKYISRLSLIPSFLDFMPAAVGWRSCPLCVSVCAIEISRRLCLCHCEH